MATRTVYNVNGYTVEVFDKGDGLTYEITAQSGMSLRGHAKDMDYLLWRIFELCIEPRSVTEEIDD